MYSFIKDIVFMEQLATFGFTETYLLTLVKDNLYCNGTKTSGIYQYFRLGIPLSGKVYKPTNNPNNKISLDVSNTYVINWMDIDSLPGFKYYFLKLNNQNMIAYEDIEKN